MCLAVSKQSRGRKTLGEACQPHLQLLWRLRWCVVLPAHAHGIHRCSFMGIQGNLLIGIGLEQSWSRFTLNTALKLPQVHAFNTYICWPMRSSCMTIEIDLHTDPAAYHSIMGLAAVLEQLPWTGLYLNKQLPCRLRVVEHNVLVISKYYSRITTKRLATLLCLQEDEVHPCSSDVS